MRIDDIVLKYVEAFETRNPKGCASCFAVDGTYSDPTRPTPIGRDQIAEEFEGLFAGFPDAVTERVGLDPISGETSAWRWVIRGTNTGPFRGTPATGRTIEVSGCEFIEARDGLIRRVVGYYDRLTLLVQLGLAPAPGARTS